MKAYQLVLEKETPRLTLVDLPDPTPSAGEVVVRVRATSLNFRDLMIFQGNYARGANYPVIPLSDGAGDVVAVGEGVTRWKPGDRVAATFFQEWKSGPAPPETAGSALGGARDGMLAERVTLNEAGLVAVPDHLSYEEAATLPCAALTAWQALVFRGRVHAGQTVLLLGTGGVSIFGLQFAKMHGARVIITSGSDEKLARARELGADFGINYRQTPDWEKEVLRLTGGAGVQQALEVGGAETFAKSLKCLALNGNVHVVGGVSGFNVEAPLGLMIGKLAEVHGIFVGSREMFEDMNRAIGLRQMQPQIDRVFPFEEALNAYAYLESGAHFGKVVITLG
jgi:NADPH:quinone reductase-like Zn-dependent oxidoreductase